MAAGSQRPRERGDAGEIASRNDTGEARNGWRTVPDRSRHGINRFSVGETGMISGLTPMDEPLLDRDGILQQLERVLSSSVFRRAERSSALLRFIVEQTLDGQADRLKEYTLGAEALGRGESFDPRTDPVVRAEASRLRTRLEQYYETTGGSDPVLVTLPKGTYVPQFAPKPAAIEETPSARAAGTAVECRLEAASISGSLGLRGRRDCAWRLSSGSRPPAHSRRQRHLCNSRSN